MGKEQFLREKRKKGRDFHRTRNTLPLFYSPEHTSARRVSRLFTIISLRFMHLLLFILKNQFLIITSTNH